MTQYTNESGIPLSLGVWLATDTYETPPEDGKKYISATSLLKSTRQIVLTNRIPKDEQKATDIKNMVASRFGTALHDSIERSWITNKKDALMALGYNEKIADKVIVNPTQEELDSGCIPVYMEQRFYKEINGWVVTGQFDFVGEGRLEDFKSTGTYTWVNNTKDDDYVMQGSIYKWGRPDIITEDTMAIQFIFKDWQGFKANSDPKYPKAMLMEKKFVLKSPAETQSIIARKLMEIDKHENTPEEDLPHCNKKELWQGDPVYKYYKDPNKRTRATKNFDSPAEANLRFIKDGSIGVVVPTVPEPVACKFCPALSICSQGQGYINSGALNI